VFETECDRKWRAWTGAACTPTCVNKQTLANSELMHELGC
jgi:hypothetical protein